MSTSGGGLTLKVWDGASRGLAGVVRRRDHWQRKDLCFIKRDAAGREGYGRQGWRGSATVLTGTR